jgi:hypothetical protein
MLSDSVRGGKLAAGSSKEEEEEEEDDMMVRRLQFGRLVVW